MVTPATVWEHLADVGVTRKRRRWRRARLRTIKALLEDCAREAGVDHPKRLLRHPYARRYAFQVHALVREWAALSGEGA